MTESDTRSETEPRATDRLRLFLWWLPAMLVPIAALHVARGDELKFYMKPLLHSGEVWPHLNTTVVHHGIAPLYLWIVAAVGQLAGGPVLGGRLLSAACVMAALGFAAGRRGPFREPLLVALLLHPLVLVYATRAHPFAPAIAMLAAGLMLRRRNFALSLLLLGGAAHLQVFFAGFAPLWGWQEEHSWPERLRRAVWACIAATAGIVLNWEIMDGMYAPSFYESELYQRGFIGAGPRDPTWAYVALVPVFAGALLWLISEARPSRRRLLVGGAAALVMAAILSIPEQPTGPFHSLLALVGAKLSAVLWPVAAAAMALGLARVNRDLPLLLAACLCGAIILQPVPAYFDRFGWWMAVCALMVWATAPREGESLATVRIAACAALGVWGSAIYTLFGRL